jgi:hypothetical protein
MDANMAKKFHFLKPTNPDVVFDGSVLCLENSFYEY